MATSSAKTLNQYFETGWVPTLDQNRMSFASLRADFRRVINHLIAVSDPKRSLRCIIPLRT